MSELLNTSKRNRGFRQQLLTTVSTVALIGFACATGEVKAADGDTDHPTVWIELGGQLERVDGGQEPFAPPFIVATPRPSVETISPLSSEHDPRYSLGGESKISFEPEGSDWAFSASVRFGRANSDKHVRQQSKPAPIYYTSGGPKATAHPIAAQFVDTKTQDKESDIVLDFQAGKDVGLGMFGRKATSVVSAGIRFAQFGLKTNVALGSDPDWHFNYSATFHHPRYEQPFHTNAAHLTATRSFHGVGPSISWNASAPVAGNADRGEIALDWGLGAAILFGRQKAAVHHQTTAQYHSASNYHGQAPFALVYQHSTHHTRARTVTVPNVGGFAGLSFLYSSAKVSFGYRADLFLGAMDSGIDTAKSGNRGFYGPFASVSVGIGG